MSKGCIGPWLASLCQVYLSYIPLCPKIQAPFYLILMYKWCLYFVLRSTPKASNVTPTPNRNSMIWMHFSASNFLGAGVCFQASARVPILLRLCSSISKYMDTLSAVPTYSSVFFYLQATAAKAIKKQTTCIYTSTRVPVGCACYNIRLRCGYP